MSHNIPGNLLAGLGKRSETEQQDRQTQANQDGRL